MPCLPIHAAAAQRCAMIVLVIGMMHPAWAQPVAPPKVTQQPTDPSNTPAAPARAQAFGSRISHLFDFLEPENLEDMPMYWEMFRPDDFPRFAIAGFDTVFGRTAPPSLRLDSQGRNVAVMYNGPDTQVHPGSEYKVEGYLHPDQLVQARVAVSAMYVDSKRQPLVDTLVRTKWYSQEDMAQGWGAFDLHLGAAPPDAHTISLIAMVVQRDTWDKKTEFNRAIHTIDIHAGAWLDDIAIIELPRLRLHTVQPGNIISPNGSSMLLSSISLQEEPLPSGRVMVYNADGKLLHTYPVDVSASDTDQPTLLDLSALQPGLYSAVQEVYFDSTVLARKEIRFARLSKRISPPGDAAHAFGVVIDSSQRTHAEAELSLLTEQLVRSAKFPLWTSHRSAHTQQASGMTEHDLMQELSRAGFHMTGVFEHAPPALVEQGHFQQRALIELLMEESSLWQEYLADVVAPLAGMFRWWQIGRDGEDHIAEDRRLADAVGNLRQGMLKFLTAPRIAVPWASSMALPEGQIMADELPATDAAADPAVAGVEADSVLPAEQISLMVGYETSPASVADQLQTLLTARLERRTAYLPFHESHRTRAMDRVSTWIKKLVAARHSGVDTVFVPQTWNVRNEGAASIAEPTEEYIGLRTLADMIGHAEPAGTMFVAEGVSCYVFRRGEHATLVMWDDAAPASGTTYPLQLGSAIQQMDYRGREQTLARDDDGRQLVTLTSHPVFIPHVEKWITSFHQSVQLTPGQISFGPQGVRMVLTMEWAGPSQATGNVRLVLPRGWEGTPTAAAFTVLPGRGYKLALDVMYPHNETAGVKQLMAQVRMTEPELKFDIPLQVELGLPELAVEALPLFKGRDLVIRQMITNRSTEYLDIRAFVAAPGKERRYKAIYGLGPGETQTLHFLFKNGVSLSGTTLHLGIRELNDGIRFHNLSLTVP